MLVCTNPCCLLVYLYYEHSWIWIEQLNNPYVTIGMRFPLSIISLSKCVNAVQMCVDFLNMPFAFLFCSFLICRSKIIMVVHLFFYFSYSSSGHEYVHPQVEYFTLLMTCILGFYNFLQIVQNPYAYLRIFSECLRSIHGSAISPSVQCSWNRQLYVPSWTICTASSKWA